LAHSKEKDENGCTRNTGRQLRKAAVGVLFDKRSERKRELTPCSRKKTRNALNYTRNSLTKENNKNASKMAGPLLHSVGEYF
jgi:hypothetical protein